MQQFLTFISHNWELSALAVVLLLGIIVIEIRERGTSDSLSPQQASMLINRKNVLVIDLRTEAQYQTGYITGAKNHPFATLATAISKLEKFKEKPILIYSDNLNHSRQAFKLLTKEGFKEVHSLAGGIPAWQKENMPLIKSSTVETANG